LKDNKYNRSNYKGLNRTIDEEATDGTKYRAVERRVKTKKGFQTVRTGTLVLVAQRTFRGVKRRQRLKAKRAAALINKGGTH